MNRLLTILAFAAVVSACTNRQVYDAVQTNEKNKCDQLQHLQREDCLKRLAPDYKEYERERKKLQQK